MSQSYAKPPGYQDFQSYGPPPQKERGCLFYGCLTVVVLGLLVVIGSGVAGFFGYRYFTKIVTENTETTPLEMPEVVISDEALDELTERFEAFRTALKEGKPAEEIELTANDLNALIDQSKDLKGHVHVDINDDKIIAQLSIPVDFLGPAGKGRYFNAEGELKVSLEDEVLVVKLKSAKIKGKEIDSNFMNSIKNQNLAKDSADNKENAEFIAKFESIHVKDGKVIIVPRKLAERQASDEAKKSDEPPAKVEEARAKATEPPAKVEEPTPAEKPKEEAPKPEPEPAKTEPAKPEEPKLAA